MELKESEDEDSIKSKIKELHNVVIEVFNSIN